MQTSANILRSFPSIETSKYLAFEKKKRNCAAAATEFVSCPNGGSDWRRPSAKLPLGRCYLTRKFFAWPVERIKDRRRRELLYKVWRTACTQFIICERRKSEFNEPSFSPRINSLFLLASKKRKETSSCFCSLGGGVERENALLENNGRNWGILLLPAAAIERKRGEEIISLSPPSPSLIPFFQIRLCKGRELWKKSSSLRDLSHPNYGERIQREAPLFPGFTRAHSNDYDDRSFHCSPQHFKFLFIGKMYFDFCFFQKIFLFFKRVENVLGFCCSVTPWGLHSLLSWWFQWVGGYVHTYCISSSLWRMKYYTGAESAASSGGIVVALMGKFPIARAWKNNERNDVTSLPSWLILEWAKRFT